MPTQTLIATTGYDRVEIGSNGWDSTLTIDQFDPMLGDLQSAVFSIDLVVEVEGSILGDTTGGPIQSASLLGSLRFSVDPLNERPTGITGTYSVAVFDPSLEISNFDPTVISLSETYASPDFTIGDLASLIGTQGFTFDIDSRERLLLDVGSGADGQEDNIDIFSTATVTVEYTYDSFTDGGVLSEGPVTTGTIGGADNDILTGSEVTDTLYGGAGNDILDGGLGPDRLQGGTGNDRYHIDDVGDVIFGEVGYSEGGGIDTVYAFIDHTLERNIEVLRLQGTDDLNGGGNWAPESLVGNTGDNRLDGSGGNDRINGKAGNDLIIGGFGSDTLVGDTGADTFRFNDTSESRTGMENRDFIHGFDRGADIIDLSEIDANVSASGDQAFNFIGNEDFSGTAGELRWFSWSGNNFNVVEADTDGDGMADMQIFVNLTNVMMQSDFLL